MRAGFLLLVLCGILVAQDLSSLLAEHRARPSDWKLCNQIAIAYTEQQQFERAAEFYRKVTALNPTFVPARKNLAVVLWFLNKKSESEILFRRLLGAIPADPVPHLYLALAHHERKEYAEAWKHFAQAGDLALKNPEVLPAALDSALATNDARATALVQWVRESGDPELAVRTSAVLNRHRKWSTTVGLLNKASGAEATLLLAEAYDRQNMPQQAYAIYARAIESNPDDAEAYTALARFAAEHQNRPHAIEVLSRGLARMPRSAPLLVSRGLLVALEGDPEQGERAFRTAADLDAQWDVPLLALGVLQLEAGRSDDAVVTFRTAADRFPKQHHAYYFYALALSRTGDALQRPAVMAGLEKAIALDPADARTRTLLGQTYVAANRLTEGVAQLKQAAQIDPANSTAQYQLSLAYRKLGNPVLADKHMARFRELKEKSPAEQSELVQVLKITK